MKYQIMIDMYHYLFECKETNNENCCKRTCGINCNIENKTECIKRHIIEQIKKDCFIKNFAKWQYQIMGKNRRVYKDQIIIKNNLISDNKYQNITIQQIEKNLKEKFEYIDEKEIISQINEALDSTKPHIYQRKKITCARCNEEFMPEDIDHLICKWCYVETWKEK